jgi:PAS domain S-box-containing protein
MTLDTSAFFEEMGPSPLALLGEVVQTTLYLFDPSSGEMLWSSRPIAALLGYDEAQTRALGPRAFATLLHPDDALKLASQRGRYDEATEHEVFRADYRLRAADGSWHWLHAQEVVSRRDADGRAGQVLGAIQNVTRARRAAEERSLLQAAVAHLDEIVLVTTPDAHIVYVNAAFERATGWKREEAVGRHVRLIASGEHDKAFYQRLWAVLLRGETWRGEFVNKRRDGSLYRESATISPVRDHAGAVTHYVAVKRDVTEVLELRETLAQSQKLEGIGHLAAGVAHDFNNILSAILGYTTLVREGLPPQGPLARDVDEIEAAAQRAAGLTRQLLAFSRKQTPTPRPLELRGLVSDLERMLRRVVRENVAIQVDLGDAAAVVRADPVQVQQVLLNLVVNASDAMPHGGRLRISVEERTMEAPRHR